MNHPTAYKEYANQLGVQMRKGLLAYCVLLICSQNEACSPDIIRALQSNSLVVVEGTMYPLLNRLQKDGLLLYNWRESAQGPPRKYYRLSEAGQEVLHELKHINRQLQTAVITIEKT